MPDAQQECHMLYTPFMFAGLRESQAEYGAAPSLCPPTHTGICVRGLAGHTVNPDLEHSHPQETQAEGRGQGGSQTTSIHT